MKKLSMCFVLILLLVMVTTACSSGPSDEECELAWSQLSSNIDPLDYDTYEEYTEAFEEDVGMTVGLILNREHAPDTVGYVVKECIQNGWDYRAASGME